MAERKRTFIAVRFSSEVESGLAEIEELLKKKLDARPRIRWVEPNNIHLTLQFLGDVDTGLFPKLAGGLRGAFGDVQPFEVAVAGLGAFPSLVRPRVVWTGFRSGADQLKTLQACVIHVTKPLGFPPEDRAFSPHITLGRVKEGGRPVDISQAVAQLGEAEVGKCQIDRVVLVTSELRPSGPVYTTLDSFPVGR